MLFKQHVDNTDYTKPENQNFKEWVMFCISNLWIPLEIIFGTALIVQLCYLKTVIGWVADAFADDIASGCFLCPFTLIPLAGTIIVAYKGLYQHFNDVCNGTSR